MIFQPMKTINRLLSLLALLALVTFGCLPLAALAQASTAADPVAAVSTADALAQASVPIIAGWVQAYPWLSTVLMVMGALRLVAKPIMSAAHAYVATTASPTDDAVVEQIEASWYWRIFCWGLDWATSVKIGTQTPKA